MRPTHLVRAVNWRHALGEVVLIVIGILIALAISDWNDRRIQRTEELALLGEIRTALSADVQTLEALLGQVRDGAARIEQLLDTLDARPPYTPEMDALFGAAYGIRTSNLNTTAYETIKSVGLRHISNPELRSQIVKVYDHYYERLFAEYGVDQATTLELMRPYYLANFKDLAFSRSATPMDYAAVINDPWYRNVVDYRLKIFQTNQLDSHPKVIAEIRTALAMLDEELGSER